MLRGQQGLSPRDSAFKRPALVQCGLRLEPGHRGGLDGRRTQLTLPATGDEGRGRAEGAPSQSGPEGLHRTSPNATSLAKGRSISSLTGPSV
jgi:hypothetical protein